MEAEETNNTSRGKKQSWWWMEESEKVKGRSRGEEVREGKWKLR